MLPTPDRTTSTTPLDRRPGQPSLLPGQPSLRPGRHGHRPERPTARPGLRAGLARVALAAGLALLLAACGGDTTTDATSTDAADSAGPGTEPGTSSPGADASTAASPDAEAPSSEESGSDTSTSPSDGAVEGQPQEHAGLAFTLPGSGTWTVAEPDPEFPGFTANLDGSFATSIAVRGLDASIEVRLEEQQALYDEQGYEVPEDWWSEVAVPGADRAVRFDWGSPSGDGAITTVLVEQGGRVVEAESYTYIEDLDLLSGDDIEAFVASIEVVPAGLA